MAGGRLEVALTLGGAVVVMLAEGWVGSSRSRAWQTRCEPGSRSLWWECLGGRTGRRHLARERAVPWAGDSDSTELSAARMWPSGPSQAGPCRARGGSRLAPQQGSSALGLIHPWVIRTDCPPPGIPTPQCTFSTGAVRVAY